MNTFGISWGHGCKDGKKLSLKDLVRQLLAEERVEETLPFKSMKGGWDSLFKVISSKLSNNCWSVSRASIENSFKASKRLPAISESIAVSLNLLSPLIIALWFITKNFWGCTRLLFRISFIEICRLMWKWQGSEQRVSHSKNWSIVTKRSKSNFSRM